MNSPLPVTDCAAQAAVPATPLLPHPQPRDVADLFISFTLLALQGFGGVMAVVHRELVEKKGWLTDDEFVEDWAVAQLMPGPNVINISLMIGNRYFGFRGAAAALAGMLAAPLVVVLLLALVHARYADHPGVIGALRGMGAVAAGLIAATALKLLKPLAANVMGQPVCYGLMALCFVAVALLRWPLLYPLGGLGLLACTLTYLKLKNLPQDVEDAQNAQVAGNAGLPGPAAPVASYDGQPDGVDGKGRQP